MLNIETDVNEAIVIGNEEGHELQHKNTIRKEEEAEVAKVKFNYAGKKNLDKKLDS